MLITSKELSGYQLPDFIVPGAAKSGTTTLYKLLQQHPKIYFPDGKKEPFYFSFGGLAPSYTDKDFVSKIVWRTDEYLNLYKDAPDTAYLGDASTSYLYLANQSISNMKLLYGDTLSKLKVFIMLRNPIFRAYSHYTYLVRNGFEKLSFEEAIDPKTIASRKNERWGFDYIAYGMYYQQVKAFRDAFPNCTIYLTEDLKDPQALCNDIFSQLGIESVNVSKDIKANPSGIPKSQTLVNLLRKNRMLKSVVGIFPDKYKASLLNRRDKVMEKLLDKEEMNPETRLALRDIFRSDIEKLTLLINRDLSHWLK